MPLRRALIAPLALALIAAVAPALAVPEGSGGAAKKPWTAADILRLRGLADPQVSPDGRWIVFVVSEADETENAFNTDLWLAPAGGTADTKPIRLTRSPKADTFPRWSPDGTRIAFLSGRPSPGGADDPKGRQLWMIRPDGGEAWMPGPIDGSVTAFAWSPDGGAIALIATEPKSAERKKREKDKDDATAVEAVFQRGQVWLMDPAGGAAVQVTRGPLHVTDLDWSPDGARLAIAAQPTPRVPDSFRSDIHLLDLGRALGALREGASAAAGGPADPKGADPNAPPPAPLGEPAPLVTTVGNDQEPRWSPDGAWIAYVTQDGNEEWFTNSYVAIVPAAGGAPRNLTRAFDERVDEIKFAPDGRHVYFGAQTGLSQQVFRVPAGGGEVAALTRGEGLSRSLSLSRDGRVAAFVREGPGVPVEVFAAPLSPEGPGGALGPLRALSGLNDWVAAHEPHVMEPFRWKGAGGMEMEGLLVRPAGAPAGRPAPLLTIVHGGPAGVFNNGYSVRRGVYPVRLFAQQGYAVFMPNPRGSGAYGEAFRKANVRDWGERDYEDIMAGIDALVAKGIADGDRLGIMGWSYGGFMTSRAITKTKRFKAASIGAAVTDTVSFTGTADIPAFMRSYFQAWPWEDPQIYTSRTALFNAKGVTTPSLIQHGEADERVPLSQGWEIYVALREQGVPVEFVTYPRQGHGIVEPKLLRDAMTRNVDWFGRWIPAGKAP